MNANHLTWKQIKELTDKALELGADVKISFGKDSAEIIITSKKNVPDTITTPTFPINPVTPFPTWDPFNPVSVGDHLNSPTTYTTSNSYNAGDNVEFKGDQYVMGESVCGSEGI